MQNIDLFVFVLAGSCLRALAFICGMKGSSPRLGSWMCLHTAGTGLEESRACVHVPELSTAFCLHSPSKHTSGRQAQALRGYRCLVSGDPCEPLVLCCIFPFELFNLAPFWVPPRRGSSLPFDSTPSQTPLEDEKRCMLFRTHQGLKPVAGALLPTATFTRQQQRFHSFLPEGLAHAAATSLRSPITELQEPLLPPK